MRAKLIYKSKTILDDSSIIELVLWKLPEKTKDRPHGFKYRLYFGDKNGNCIVRYDNETGKGDHKHIGKNEYPYQFQNKDKLLRDFMEDIQRVRKS